MSCELCECRARCCGSPDDRGECCNNPVPDYECSGACQQQEDEKTAMIDISTADEAGEQLGQAITKALEILKANHVRFPYRLETTAGVFWLYDQEQPDFELSVLMITTAYEQGVGDGRKGKPDENPYAPGAAREAWRQGYDEGVEQVESESATAGIAAANADEALPK